MNATSSIFATNQPATPEILGQQRGQIHYARSSILRQPGNLRLYIPGRHAPGTKIRFPGSGDLYLVGTAGNLVRIH